MGNFNNVSLGNGSLSINSVDVGYLKGDVQFSYTYDSEDLETRDATLGYKTLTGRISKMLKASLTAPLAELSADNISIALGGLTASTVLASEVDLTASWHELTAAKYRGHGTLYAIKLGPLTDQFQNVTISGAGSAPSIDRATPGTLYVENDDYIIDYATGWAYFNPGGTKIANLAADSYVVNVKYKYTPASYKQLALGYTAQLQELSNLVFTHRNPTTGLNHVITFHKCFPAGQMDLSFTEDSFIINNVRFDASNDATGHSTSPLGTYKVYQS